MSLFASRTGLILGGIFFALIGRGHAEQWVRGSVAVTAVSGELQLESLGGQPYEMGSVSLPYYSMGLLSARVAAEGEIFMEASNHVRMDCQGAGFFAIERFEQEGDFTGDWFLSDIEAGQSRMIFSLRSGMLAVDSRSLSEASQLIAETPFGRITVGKALWIIGVRRDERKRTYSFDVLCAEGALRLTDKTGASYKILGGQRISGVGTSDQPSIEVAEITDEGRERFDDFSALSERLEALDVSAEALAEQMEPLLNKVAVESETEDRLPNSAGNDGRRPILIEYAPRAAPVTPFRGEARPPSAYEADLF